MLQQLKTKDQIQNVLIRGTRTNFSVPAYLLAASVLLNLFLKVIHSRKFVSIYLSSVNNGNEQKSFHSTSFFSTIFAMSLEATSISWAR